MMLLGIDTATDTLSIAVLIDGVIAASFSVNKKNAHDELLNPLIDQMLRFGNWLPEQIAAVAVSIGPGSFTGLRIGLATAKGIAFALDIPLLAVPTFDAMAYRLARLFFSADARRVAAVFDARRDDVYLAVYELQTFEYRVIRSAYATNALLAAQELDAGTLLIGNGAQKIFASHEKKFDIIPDLEATSLAEAVAFIGKTKFEREECADRQTIEPLYLRNFHVTTPKPLFL